MAQNATPGDGERNGARPSPVVAAPNSGELVLTEVPRAYRLAGESARHLSRRAWGLVARRVRHELFMNAMMDRTATLTFFTVLRLRVILGMGRARHNPARGVTRRSSPLRVVGAPAPTGQDNSPNMPQSRQNVQQTMDETATILTLFLARVTC